MVQNKTHKTGSSKIISNVLANLGEELEKRLSEQINLGCKPQLPDDNVQNLSPTTCQT